MARDVLVKTARMCTLMSIANATRVQKFTAATARSVNAINSTCWRRLFCPANQYDDGKECAPCTTGRPVSGGNLELGQYSGNACADGYFQEMGERANCFVERAYWSKGLQGTGRGPDTGVAPNRDEPQADVIM